ncbi:hypothetical protein AAG906_014443 [Vitis piasezkii]
MVHFLRHLPWSWLWDKYEGESGHGEEEDGQIKGQNSTEAIIMSALSTLSATQISHLTRCVYSILRYHHLRLSSLLSSPTIFAHTLHHLHSISLPHKTLLIARHLLSTLHHLTRFFQSTVPPPYSRTSLKLRDLDAVLLLLLLCQLRQHDPQALETCPSEWRTILCTHFSKTMLSLSGTGATSGAVLIPYIEVAARCRRFVGAVLSGGGGGGGEKLGREVGHRQLRDGGVECVICKEEMRQGRDVCELPCEHLFHWMCILPWLVKRNTCPCCRFQLPSDDVFAEIERLWDVVVKSSSVNPHGECT